MLLKQRIPSLREREYLYETNRSQHPTPPGFFLSPPPRLSVRFGMLEMIRVPLATTSATKTSAISVWNSLELLQCQDEYRYLLSIVISSHESTLCFFFLFFFCRIFNVIKIVTVYYCLFGLISGMLNLRFQLCAQQAMRPLVMSPTGVSTFSIKSSPMVGGGEAICEWGLQRTI